MDWTAVLTKPILQVGIVMIKCPTTGHAISTGIEADRDGFSRGPVFFAGLIGRIDDRLLMHVEAERHPRQSPGPSPMRRSI
jgi:hypothetical protein